MTTKDRNDKIRRVMRDLVYHNPVSEGECKRSMRAALGYMGHRFAHDEQPTPVERRMAMGALLDALIEAGTIDDGKRIRALIVEMTY